MIRQLVVRNDDGELHAKAYCTTCSVLLAALVELVERAEQGSAQPLAGLPEYDQAYAAVAIARAEQ